MTTLEDEFTLLGAEPGSFACYGFKNITCTVWTGQATGAAGERLNHITDALRKRYPVGISGIHLVRDRTKLPDTAAREALVRITNEHADVLVCVAVVIEGSGFWASTMRSVVTAMRVLGPRTFDLRIHGRVQEIVEWLPDAHVKRTGVRFENDELISLIERARTAANALAAGPSP